MLKWLLICILLFCSYGCMSTSDPPVQPQFDYADFVICTDKFGIIVDMSYRRPIWYNITTKKKWHYKVIFKNTIDLVPEDKLKPAF